MLLYHFPCGVASGIIKSKGWLPLRTDSPDTGEVARSARGGALSPQATEGDTKELTTAKSQALPPTRFAGTPSQRGPFFIGIQSPFLSHLTVFDFYLPVSIAFLSYRIL